MNNSFDRLIEGMIESLRLDVIPHVSDDFARGQAYGVIYVLSALKMRASWSPDFLRRQIADLVQLSVELAAIPEIPEHAWLPVTLPSEAYDVAALEKLRDEGDARVCRLMQWLEEQPTLLSETTRLAARAAVNSYIHAQLKWELACSPRPMFAEISLGREDKAAVI